MRFVLVHGGMHGAWCWSRVVEELERRGHEAVTMDLPGHGERRDESSDLAGYRDAVVEVMQPHDVLVGHSMGCAIATMAADAFADIAHIIYLAGPLPVEGRPITWEVAYKDESKGELDAPIVNQHVDALQRFSADGAYVYVSTVEAATTLFYNDCPPELAQWAFDRLTPLQVDILAREPVSVPRFWSLELPRSYICGARDQAVKIEWSRQIAQRLGVEMLTIDSSHSPFLSRPGELVDLFLHAVETVPTGKLDPQGPGQIKP